MRRAQPMQRGIGEHGVELGREVERVSVELADRKTLHARDSKQLIAQIDAKYTGSRRLDLGGERAVPAAEIEDALARTWAKHGEDRACQVVRPFRA